MSEAATAADEPSDFGGDDRSARVLDALGRLNEADAEILRLAVWEELPHREIAHVMDCTENAVAIRIHRARQRLAGHLSANATADRADVTTDVTTASTHAPTPLTEGDRNA